VVATCQARPDGTDEADSHRVDLMLVGGLKYESSDAVHRDDLGGEFFAHTVDGLASQHVGSERAFQLPKQRLHSLFLPKIHPGLI
jgi:hypothetical protein